MKLDAHDACGQPDEDSGSNPPGPSRLTLVARGLARRGTLLQLPVREEELTVWERLLLPDPVLIRVSARARTSLMMS